MLRRIRVTPLAAESLGVRSMCTVVETPDVKVLLDAAASLGPSRWGLPSHPREYGALAACRERISKAAEKADVITISHYHFDHHTPSFTDWVCNWSSAEVATQIYEDKIVLAKSHRSKVNPSQRRRGWMFRKTAGKQATKLDAADGRTFGFGDTTLKFSEPVFHGIQNTFLGWVLMTTINYGDERILFTSDVEGPMYNPTVAMILGEAPDLLIIGGPPLYLAGFKVDEAHVQQGIKNLEELVRNIPTTILEHHILRDEKWREACHPVFDAASKAGHAVLTAAEFLKKENSLLECRRRALFEAEPPSADFKKWLNLPRLERTKVRPPI
jgi:predicted metallo-beta-lactamase superfamily hydrolase